MQAGEVFCKRDREEIDVPACGGQSATRMKRAVCIPTTCGGKLIMWWEIDHAKLASQTKRDQVLL